MSLEILASIEQAEARAEEVRAQAQREAREMLKSVEEACVQGERTAALDQRAMMQSLVEEARLAADKRIRQMAAQEAVSREALMDVARVKLDEAADVIFERVVENGHR